MIERTSFATCCRRWRSAVLGGVMAIVGGASAIEPLPAEFAPVKGVLESSCVKCHCADRFAGGLRLDIRELALAGGDTGAVIVPGHPEKSTLYTSTLLPAESDEAMPPREPDRLASEETEILKSWIAAGARWPNGVTLERQEKVRFLQIAPILIESCIACHGPDMPAAGLRLDHKAAAFAGGKSGAGIVPFQAHASAIFRVFAQPKHHPPAKPSRFKAEIITEEELVQLRNWIDQGAPWPGDEELKLPRSKPGNRK